MKFFAIPLLGGFIPVAAPFAAAALYGMPPNYGNPVSYWLGLFFLHLVTMFFVLTILLKINERWVEEKCSLFWLFLGIAFIFRVYKHFFLL